MTDPENGQQNLRSRVNLDILKALRANGVEIPFPQRVVHLPAPEVVVADMKPSPTT
jgi:small-conductance mechanosensitive channel